MRRESSVRSFFRTMFASIVGISIVLFVFCLIVMGSIAGFASMGKVETIVKDDSILKIQFKSGIVDRASENIFEDYTSLMGDKDKPMSLNTLLKSIKNATADDKIKGILLDFSIMFGAGKASLEEIRNALLDFKESGKFVYSYGLSYGQSAYYLASVADSVFVHPEGSIDFKGLSMRVMFLKNALAKLGVSVDVIRQGKFKGAVEPYLRTNMSAENREQYMVLANSMWDNMLTGIAASRNMTKAELNKIADDLSATLPSNMAKLGLVDAVITSEEIEELLCEQLGKESGKDLNFISLKKYAKAPQKLIETKDRIAVIYAQGEISATSKGNSTTIGLTNISNAIIAAKNCENVKAIVLRVNSPGGSVLTSDIIYQAILSAKEKKPVVASYGDYAASGGYYISCPVDKIYSNPSTLTGSIGVFGMIPNAKELLNNKLGVYFDGVTTNKNSAFLTSFDKGLTYYEKEVLQKNIANIYNAFVTKVSDGRDITVGQVDSIAQGRIWTGSNAIAIKLVDELGGLYDAIEGAAELAKLEEYRLVEYPKEKDAFAQMMEMFKMAKVSYLEKEFAAIGGTELINTVKSLQKAAEIGETAVYMRMHPIEIR